MCTECNAKMEVLPTTAPKNVGVNMIFMVPEDLAMQLFKDVTTTIPHKLVRFEIY